MTKRIWIYRDGEAIEITGEKEPEPTIHVIGDVMEPTRHMGLRKFNDDGTINNSVYISSKSKFRQVTRDVGCYEVGNDTFGRGEKPLKVDVKNIMM